MFAMKKDKVLEFIQRRFSTDCNWTDGNCYFLALILADVFGGDIWYECIAGHFVCMIGGMFYDWGGVHDRQADEFYVRWNEFKQYDGLRYERIIRDCCR